MKNNVPRKILSAVYNLTLKLLVKKINTRVSARIPKIEINEVHIRNTKLLTTREELIKHLPKQGVVGEMGVDQGHFSKSILNLNNPKTLHLIDFWGSKRYGQEKKKLVETKFKKEIEDQRIKIDIGLSTEVVNIYPDNYFDWIYIDTDHSYKTTIKELEVYRNKIKPNGFIAGHDYSLGNWDGLVRYGVREAVYEFCTKYNWEIVFLTSEINNSPSFAIKEINRH